MSNENSSKYQVCKKNFTMAISNYKYPSGIITMHKTLEEGGVSE